MIFEFSKYKVDIDVHKTSNFYKTARLISNGCSCDGCRNFEKAIDFFPHEIISFFSQLGIEMKKICEVYVNCANADNTIFYGGFYHICGKLISGENAWVSTNPNMAHWNDEKAYNITNDFRVSFSENCNLLEKDFPSPTIQLDISADIPWVLEEKNNYPKDINRRK